MCEKFWKKGLWRDHNHRGVSPIVVVDKDGGYRFCIDFRTLNKITTPLAYPLSLIDDILALFRKATCFCFFLFLSQSSLLAGSSG